MRTKQLRNNPSSEKIILSIGLVVRFIGEINVFHEKFRRKVRCPSTNPNVTKYPSLNHYLGAYYPFYLYKVPTWVLTM